METQKKSKSPFKSYYQVSKKNTVYIRQLAATNPKALELFFFLTEHMNEYNAVICSYKVFEQVLRIKRTRIYECINDLKNLGFLYVYKSGTSNVYVANQELVWNSWEENLKYCKFPANIVLTLDEQDKEYLENLEIKKRKGKEGSIITVVENERNESKVA